MVKLNFILMPGKFSVTQNSFGQLLALLHQMVSGDSVAGKLIQGKSLCIGFLLDTVVGNLLMWMYCKCVEFSVPEFV